MKNSLENSILSKKMVSMTLQRIIAPSGEFRSFPSHDDYENED